MRVIALHSANIESAVPRETDPKPQYTRYRAGRKLLPGERQNGGDLRDDSLLGASRHPRAPRTPSRWRRPTPKRVALGLLALIAGWLALSLVLFLISSHFERTSLPSNVAGVLDPAGYPLTSANNILVLGSDRRQKDSREPGAETTGSAARTRSC